MALYFTLPVYINRHTHSASAACINNLRQIDGAKEQRTLENKKSTNDLVTVADLQPYLGRGTAGAMPQSPGGGHYIIGRVGETPRCSIGGVNHTLN